MRLSIVTTHPIQYNAPIFKLLSIHGKVIPHVFYTWPQGVGSKYDPDFGKEVNWDQPLLEGYHFSFVENTSSAPGSHHYRGIINPTLVESVIDFDPAAILLYGWKFHSHLCLMRSLKGRIPILFRGDSHLLDEKPGGRSIARRIILRRVYRKVDHALYCGLNNRDYFLAHGLQDFQLSFMPHCVDNDFFGSNDKVRHLQAIEQRRTMGIDDGQIIIMFIGKFIEKKNPVLLLEAFDGLSDSARNRLGLFFVGSGKLEDQLKTRARQTQMGNIFFLPFQNQSTLPLIYRMGDVLALPSKGPGETWGLSVNEAMASSRSVLVSDHVGCARDLVENRETGWMFESDSIDSLQSVLEEISGLDRDRLLEKGQRARNLICEYSLESAAKAVEECVFKFSKN